MTSWRDRLNKLGGRTRFVVCRIFVHLAGADAAPLLGRLNEAARRAYDSDGELDVLGESLVEVCQAILQYDTFWRSAANEGDVFWDEGEAGNYVNELFTDSASRYLSGPEREAASQPRNASLTLGPSQNIVVMLTVAYEGEVPALETSLADAEALRQGLKAMINLHYSGTLRAVQVHFSPAQLGDELDGDQLLVNFSELVPL